MDSLCKGCDFHIYPYKAQPPVAIDGGYKMTTFSCDEDIYDIVKLLIKETEEMNERGKSFDVALSVSKQLPFFCCNNRFYDNVSQRAIEQYVYCKDFGISPYKGSYGDQPKKWVDKMFLIKKALAKREESMMNKQNKGLNNG